MRLFYKKNAVANFLNSIKANTRKDFTRLSSNEWSRAYLKEREENIDVIKNDRKINEWTYEIERLTKNTSGKVIEIGCALGLSSLYLAKRGRKVTGLDYSSEMCGLFLDSAEKLGLHVESICADITKPLPIADNEYDVVWHAGVIEHFSGEEIQFIINENARIAKGRVISMCPNANSLAYRIGKEIAERNGTWKAGEENPKYTLKDVFLSAGLKNISEYTIDLDFALAFLPHSVLKDFLSQMYINLPTDDDCRQGYLLVTIGDK
jgi:2-polyprenyl-3-methyl-5-hydroxy-6-metoxy-1,4-benzoquinol methylase